MHAIKFHWNMRLSRRRKFTVLLGCSCFVLAVCFYLLTWDKNCSSPYTCLLHVLSTKDKKSSVYCILPKLDPFDQTVRHLIKNYSDDITDICGRPTKVFQLVNGRIKILSSSLWANISENSAKFQTVLRPRSEDDVVIFGEKIPIKGNTKVRQDFVKVSYKFKNGRRKVELLAQIVEKREVLKRKSDGSSLNVVLMGFDSTSNANFKRKLPRSYSYLIEKFSAFVFNGYSTVGDGTTAALTAVLTGNVFGQEREDTEKNLENWPWIMKDFKRRGYVTLYAEDDPRVASFSKIGGFRKEPADHYIRPFWLAVERYGFDGERRNKSDSLHRICVNNEPMHNITLNYVREFMDSYPGVPKFAFPYFSYLPHGTGEKLSLADKDLFLFLKNYEKYSNNTILIIFGDHGSRIGDIRNTIQGTYEEHLPWLSMLLPSWFHHKYPTLTRNLMVNQGRVVSPFDLHHSLHHILTLKKQTTYLKLQEKQFGTSLMSELDPQRTCEDAGVNNHWCPCLRWQVEDVNSASVKKGAQLLIDYINKMISKKPMFIHLCFTIYLLEITLAAKAELDDVVYYKVTVSTRPGGGLFQATFRLDPNSKMVMNSRVSRTSMYGKNPWCLGGHDHFMKKFCTCKVPHKKQWRTRS